MSTDLVTVDFHGDTLWAVREDNEVFVSLKQVCACLEINYSKQLQKLKALPWATVYFKYMVAQDGKEREFAMLNTRTLAGWLFNIHYKKVKKEAQKKLVLYQNECADALVAYFEAKAERSADAQPKPQKLLACVARAAANEDMSDVIPVGFWCVFQQGWDLLLRVESRMGFPVGKYDLLDGSIGSRWRTYRLDKEWAVESKRYPHVFTDQRGTQMANAYNDSELGHFNTWFRQTYIPVHLPVYLEGKYDVTPLQKQKLLALTGGKKS